MATGRESFLGLEGLHVFITGAAGGIGAEAAREFLRNGCNVSAVDRRTFDVAAITTDQYETLRVHPVIGDQTSEDSISAAFSTATSKFGPPNILIANAGMILDEAGGKNIWDADIQDYDQIAAVNSRGTFLVIKHFLSTAKRHQEEHSTELNNLSIVVTGSETAVFGYEQAVHYASSKAAIQYGIVRSVKNEIVRLNSKGRINAIAPGFVQTPLIGDLLDNPRELWEKAQSTVALKKIAKPSDVARVMAFLASHRASGHISGQCISVDGGMEGRLVWTEDQVLGTNTKSVPQDASRSAVPVALSPPTRPRRLRICLSVDFDALSGYLGTGHTPHNTLSDHSAGIFSARVGVSRVLSLFKKHKISQSVTWFVPGHSMETFPEATKSIVDSGAEVGLHGYSHEGAYDMTPEQEKDVLEKCIDLATKLTGKRPVGYRAPLYQFRETTVSLLQSQNFLYDTSMNAHDSQPYFLPSPFPTDPPHAPDYSKDAASWMHPTLLPEEPAKGTSAASKALVEIPASWYTEDMTPLGFYPYTPSSHGYVPVDVVEKMWWDRFDWLWDNECFVDDTDGFGSVYPMIWHPESAGRAHVVGMIDHFLARLQERAKVAGQGEITFETFESVARTWKGSDGDSSTK